MSLELEFDLLRGRGKAQFGVADTPNVYARSKFFAPGFVTHTRTSNCLGNEQTEITALPVFSHSEDSMFREDIGWWMLAHTWPVVRTTGGAWRIAGSIHLDADGWEPPHTASLNVTVAGTPVSLNADCRLPTPSDLKRARTTTAAKRITARAGSEGDHRQPAHRSRAEGPLVHRRTSRQRQSARVRHPAAPAAKPRPLRRHERGETRLDATRTAGIAVVPLLERLGCLPSGPV